MAVYIPQIQCVLIDANGVRANAASLTFDVYNITAAASVGTMSSDTNGIIASASTSGSNNDIFEFTHATYPGVYRCKIKETKSDAYVSQGNYGCTYVVEDLQTPAVSDKAILIAVDLDNPDAVPIKLGTALSGTTSQFGIQRGSVARDYRIYPISQRVDGGIVKADYDLFTTEYADVTIPAVSGSGLTQPEVMARTLGC
jgi:hypothetical protein